MGCCRRNRDRETRNSLQGLRAPRRRGWGPRTMTGRQDAGNPGHERRARGQN